MLHSQNDDRLIEAQEAIYWGVKGHGKIERLRGVGIERRRRGWAGGVELRTSIKNVSEQPAMRINGDKKPEGLV